MWGAPTILKVAVPRFSGPCVTLISVSDRSGKVLAGVCAALADRFGVPRTLVRVGFVLFGLFGVGEAVYIGLWVLIPKSAND